ncbi:MAG: nitroreductase family protein [Defluviitaleaceae bacterium]|nr:nitroreductase family protein [Defluviitaleaceae bacterium]
MDAYAAINGRRTIRDFDGGMIDMEIIERILDAGLKAPTNDHMRSWEFVIVNNADTRARILEAVKESHPGTKADIEKNVESWGMADKEQKDMYLDAVPKQYSMLYNAGCLILPFFRYGKDQDFLRPKALSSLNSFASMWCCIENILIAAAAESVFGVTRIPLGSEAERIKKVIRYPDNYLMPCYLALGYPAKDAKFAVQKEFSIKDKIHLEKW